MSWQLALFTGFSRLIVKRAMTREHDVVKARAGFDLLASKLFRKPGFLAQSRDQLRHDGRDVPALWVSVGAPQSDHILLYIHGGGYIMGSPQTHKGMVAYLARMLGVRAVMPDYALAPEQKFPAGLDDVIASYFALLERGYRPEQIILGGESAGGGLVFSLLAHLSQIKSPMPACVFAISPSLDLTFSSPSFIENARSDAVLPASRTAYLRALYLDDHPPEDPLASPLFANFQSLPPVLIHASDGEILRDEAERMAARLKEAEADVTLKIWRSDIHVFHILVGFIPEAKTALRHVADFVQATLKM